MSKGTGIQGKLTKHQTYEFEDWMQNIKPPERTFWEFIYDRNSGKILTRTPKSWCKCEMKKVELFS